MDDDDLDVCSLAVPTPRPVNGLCERFAVWDDRHHGVCHPQVMAPVPPLDLTNAQLEPGDSDDEDFSDAGAKPQLTIDSSSGDRDRFE